MRQVVFDLETTGFKHSEGHRIVEIGGVELVNGAVTGRNFHTYVNPERDMPEAAFQVHGLSAEFLRDKPRFADQSAAPAFLAFIGDAEMIAHNGLAFDLPFLQAELAGAGLPALENALTDTMIMARRKFPGAPASLDALCARFGIDINERQREGHGALLDSKLLAAVYIELTGGAQAGLDFTRHDVEQEDREDGRRARSVVRPRPRPLAPRLTDAERAAHEEFIGDLGEASLWRRLA